MRTTLTITDSIDRRLRKYAEERHISYKEIINTVLEKGLENLEALESMPRYQVESKKYGLKTGVDPVKFNQLYDDLESGEFDQ